MDKKTLFSLCLAVCIILLCSGCGAKRKARIYRDPANQSVSDLQSQMTEPRSKEETETNSGQETTTPSITNASAETSSEQKSPSQSDDRWKTAYMQFLRKYMDDRDLHDQWDYGAFSLVFIDNDDIPELVVSENTSHAADTSVLSYGITGLVNHGTFGTFGRIQYLEKKNIIVSDVVYQGNGTLTIHKLTPTGAKELWHGAHGYAWDDEVQASIEEFWSYDKPVSEDMYFARYHQFVPDESDLKSSLDESNPYAFTLTEENIERINQISLE